MKRMEHHAPCERLGPDDAERPGLQPEEEMGVGKQMVLRLIDKLSQQRRNEILLDLRESNLDGQLFFRTQGFRAVKVVRCHYDDTAEDAYIMQFRLDHQADEMAPYIPQNRISDIEAA